MGVLGGVCAGGVAVGVISLIGGTKSACRRYLHGRGKPCCALEEEI